MKFTKNLNLLIIVYFMKNLNHNNSKAEKNLYKSKEIVLSEAIYIIFYLFKKKKRYNFVN